jgi:hypothetical protein
VVRCRQREEQLKKHGRAALPTLQQELLDAIASTPTLPATKLRGLWVAVESHADFAELSPRMADQVAPRHPHPAPSPQA